MTFLDLVTTEGSESSPMINHKWPLVSESGLLLNRSVQRHGGRGKQPFSQVSSYSLVVF